MVLRENPGLAGSRDPVRASARGSQLFPARGVVEAAGPLVLSHLRVCQAGCLLGAIRPERLNYVEGRKSALPVGWLEFQSPRYGMLTREICHILVMSVASSAVAIKESRTGS